MWSWSHTAEGIDNVRRNIGLMSDDEIAVCYAEIRARIPSKCAYFEDGFHAGRYPFALAGARAKISKGMRELIEDAIFDFACEQALCDNGGFDAHVCPFGCHTVSFSFGVE